MRTRRDVIVGAAAQAAVLLPGALGTKPAMAATASVVSGWNVPFGAAVRTGHLFDPAFADYASAIVKYCDVIVAEGGMKWGDMRPSRDAFDFSEGDRLVKFARDHVLGARGHTLVWYGYMPNPDWTKEISSALEAERELVKHIETVMGRYKDDIRSWDVVNEAVDVEANDPQNLRQCVWLKHLGPKYLDIAFRTAAAVDPTAKLALNDMNIENADPLSRAKRAALWQRITSLKDKGIPIHCVGLQGHLRPEKPIDKEGLSKFVTDVRNAGLDVMVTELDVIDKSLASDPVERDQQIASFADDFLGSIFAAAKPVAVLTWGITDKFSWVPVWFKRDDGRPNRPLPLDENFKPKPMFSIIEKYCRGT